LQMPDGPEKKALESQAELKTNALETGSAMFRVASMLAALNARIGSLRFDDVADITQAAIWPLMEKELNLPRSRPGVLSGAAEVEMLKLQQEQLGCLQKVLADLVSGKTEAEWFERNFSGFQPFKSDGAVEDLRVPILAFLFEFTRTSYLADCRDISYGDILTAEARKALEGLTFPAPPQGTLAAKLEQFRLCVDSLPRIHKARRRLGVVDEIGPIGCSRLAFASGSPTELLAKLKAQERARDNGGDLRPGESDNSRLCLRVWLNDSYSKTINEELERLSIAAKANNRITYCRAAHDAKIWAAAGRAAFGAYCKAEGSDHPFMRETEKVSSNMDDTIRKFCNQ
jgi:hypothetical protein